MWLTRLALKNPILILMMSLMVIVLGWVSLSKLSVDLFPEMDIPIVNVATFYTGAGPADIEKTVTMPIERAVASAPGVDKIESISKQGFSSVRVWFQYGVNLDNAQFEVSQRVAQILNTLPPGINQPFIMKFDITNIPIIQVALSGKGLDEKQLYDLGYNVIEPQLERIRGVASASLAGGKVREIGIHVQRDALRARGLGILDVVNAVRTSNLLLPSGSLRTIERDYNVFVNTQFDETRSLKDVVVKTSNKNLNDNNGEKSGTVRVRDVATVVDGTADSTEIVRINGQRGVALAILKQPGANTVSVVDAVKKALPKLRGIPETVQLQVFFDQSTYIRAAITSLEHEALQGGLLATLIILIFLVSLPATGIIAIAIPLSIIATFVIMYFTGQTLNVFTLGGLALGVGRLVDDSIVELENIHRHLALGGDRTQAVLGAAQEVAMPIFVSTLTTISVFFPVVFLSGIARNLFLPLALTIAFSLLMSFFVSRTVTPVLCLKYLPASHELTKGRFAHLINSFFDRVDELYAEALNWVLNRRKLVIISIGIFFIASLMLLKYIGTEFFPDTDEGQIGITYKAPIGSVVTKTELIAKRIEETIKEVLDQERTVDGEPIYKAIISQDGLPAGKGAIFTTNTGTHAGYTGVNLVSRNKRSVSDTELADRIRRALDGKLPGTSYFFFVGGIVKRVLNFGSPAPIDVEIVGYDLEAGSTYAKRLLAKMRTLVDPQGKPLLTDLQITREENYPELDVTVDREKAGILGLTQQEIAQTVLTSLVGNTKFAPMQFIDTKTGNEYYINVRLDDPFRTQVKDLADIFVRTPVGAVVSLSNIAKIKRDSGPVAINRKYLDRLLDVTANVAPGQNLGHVSTEISKVIEELPPPDGFTAALGGQTAAQKEAFWSLLFACALAIALVYMILASQFKSLLDPLVIMFSVPLGISGVFIALWVTGTTLNVNSFMGIIMMVGIVVSNGVLLIDFARVLRSRGHELREATILAGKTRLRPILMTTIATIVGLLPMALGIGEGSETNLPLARAVIGGLIVSTFFTLFLIPSLYTLLERLAKSGTHEPTM